MEQMTVFELLPADPIPDNWRELDPAKVAAIIAQRFGQVPAEYFGGWSFRVGPLLCTVDIQEYNTLDDRNGRKFIGIGCDNKQAYAGAGGPCDTIAEAIEYMQKLIKNLGGLSAVNISEE